MNPIIHHKIRFYTTGLVTVSIWSLLIWNHFNGGIPSHHILARKDLPEISNVWGALLLPLLTYAILLSIQRRVRKNYPDGANLKIVYKPILLNFIAALICGTSLAVTFVLGISEIPFYILLGILFLSLFLPIYRAEFLLGFVLSMTYTFGAVLPTGIGSILLILGSIIHLLIRPFLIFIGKNMLKMITQNAKQ